MCEHFRVSEMKGQAKMAERTVTGWVASAPVSGGALLPLVKVRSGNNCVLYVCTVQFGEAGRRDAGHCCCCLPSLCDLLGNYRYSDFQRTPTD